MAIKAVLFDLDGTLISTKRLYLEAYRKTLVAYVGRELTDHDLLALDSRSERRLLGSCVPAEKLTGCIHAFQQQYAALHPAFFDGVYAGVPELLSALKQRGLKIGIVSGKSRAAWLTTVAHTALGEFDVVVLDDEMQAPKPNPHGIESALAALATAASQAIYVGDAVFDLDAARAAGVRAAAALWSKENDRYEAFLQAAKQRGAILLNSPTDLLDYEVTEVLPRGGSGEVTEGGR